MELAFCWHRRLCKVCFIRRNKGFIKMGFFDFRPLTVDIEPVYCYLGHTGAVYSVILASSKVSLAQLPPKIANALVFLHQKQCFSAGADCSIRIWQMPDARHQDLYAERGIAITFNLFFAFYNFLDSQLLCRKSGNTRFGGNKGAHRCNLGSFISSPSSSIVVCFIGWHRKAMEY